MSKTDFKYIRAGYKQGQPAHINFYDDVDYWSVNDFINEFHYLEEYIEPSEIVIHINSAGGSVIDGISIFAIIQNCKIKTKTINDGLAASMGSIIWSAGKEIYMKDYSLLMIHNPFNPNTKDDNNDAIDAFKKQLALIYQKRFGLSEDRVSAIMNGEEGKDGTWFTASDAVKEGFLQENHVIATSEAERTEVTAKINGISDLKEIAHIMASIKTEPTVPQNNIHNNKSNTMEKEFMLVAAQLGMSSDKATEVNVQARIKELLAKESSFNGVKDELDSVKSQIVELKATITGKDTAIDNLTQNLKNANAQLQVYKDAENAAKEKAISNLVDAAINVCKIKKEDRETWVSMATANFDLAKKTLDGIPARKNISGAIAEDPENHKNVKEGMTDMEREIKARVDEVVGPQFKFQSWEN